MQLERAFLPLSCLLLYAHIPRRVSARTSHNARAR